MAKIYLGIGSNQGDRKNNLLKALASIRAMPLFELSQSTIIETDPYGFMKQDKFLNMVVGGETLLNPHQLLQTIKRIETELGREITFHWGPRIIDIDILFYDNIIIHEQNLIIPHPDIINRLFVLAPLAEIAPDFIHPSLKKTICSLLIEFVA